MAEKYLIGDVARILGLTPAALHYYEREGVSENSRGDATRRSYDMPEIVRLLSYKKYRSMEMPMKEIAMQFSLDGGDFQQITERLERQQEEVRQMSLRYARLAEDVNWFVEHVHHAQGALGRVDVAALPACYVLSIGEGGVISKDRDEQLRAAEWLEEMPATHISMSSDTQGNARFCYSIDEERARSLGFDKTPGAVHRVPQTALHTFLTLDKRFFGEPEMAFVLLRTFLQEHGFVQDGDALGVILCVAHIHQVRTSLCEVWLPFR